MSDAIGDGSSVGAADVIGQRSGGRPVIAPEKQYRGGGRQGRTSIKAIVELRDHRWVQAHPDDEPLTPERAALQKVRREAPEVFLTRLAELEREHAAVVEKAKAAKAVVESPPPKPAALADCRVCDYSPEEKSASQELAVATPDVVALPPPGRPAVSDPEKFKKIKRWVEGLKKGLPSGRDGDLVIVYVGVLAKLPWLAKELRNQIAGQEWQSLTQVRSWAANVEYRYFEMIAKGVFVKLEPAVIVPKLEWLVKEIDALLASGNGE